MFFFYFFFFFIKYMTEKMGGAEGTKLDVDFVDMERVSEMYYLKTNQLKR